MDQTNATRLGTRHLFLSGLKRLVACIFIMVHTQSFADAFPPSVDSKKERVVVRFEISGTGHPVVRCSYGRRALKFVIDSASGVNVIDLQTQQRLGIKAKGKEFNAAGLGTSSQKSIPLEPLQVELGGARVTIAAIGIDLKHVKFAGGGGGLDGLLGSPFLIRHNATIDFASRTLSFDKKPSRKRKAAKKPIVAVRNRRTSP